MCMKQMRFPPEKSFVDFFRGTIILTGVNEYSVEIYRRVLPLWSGGTQVYLVGAEWKNYLPVLPKPEGIFVEVFEQLPAFLSPEKNKGRGNLYIIEGLPRNESSERYEKGCMYYDEIMQLTFMFSYVIHPGKKNPHKKFFLIDGFYRIEGMFGIWNKAFTAARYAMAKGYTPVFEIVSYDANMYSDHEGDDIWNKFFMQPVDCPLSEIHESSYLALSPNMNILNTVRSIMDKVSGGGGTHMAQWNFQPTDPTLYQRAEAALSSLPGTHAGRIDSRDRLYKKPAA